MFTNLSLTGMDTFYKVYRRDILNQISIEEDRYGIEPKVTAKWEELVLEYVFIMLEFPTKEESKKKVKKMRAKVWT